MRSEGAIRVMGGVMGALGAFSLILVKSLAY
jgi:hypothetical protein